jgi:hypothetical protein
MKPAQRSGSGRGSRRRVPRKWQEEGQAGGKEGRPGRPICERVGGQLAKQCMQLQMLLGGLHWRHYTWRVPQVPRAYQIEVNWQGRAENGQGGRVQV